MGSDIKGDRDRKNLFSDLTNLELVDYLCLMSIGTFCRRNQKSICTNELAYDMLANYWSVECNEAPNNKTKLLNEIRSQLISKYMLTQDTSANDIIQVLKYEDDRHLNIKLYGVMKDSLKKFSNIFENNLLADGSDIKWKKSMMSTGIRNGHLIKSKSNDVIVVDSKWADYISSVDTLRSDIEYGIKTLGSIDQKLEKQISKAPVEKAKPSKAIEDIEKKIHFLSQFDKTQYKCLEEAFQQVKISHEKYVELHEEFLEYVSKHSVSKASVMFPLSTSLLLIYTALYRYHEDYSNGFWPEFFDGNDSYSYTRDVPCVMRALEKSCTRYNVNTIERRYLSKSNLSKIFAQIYLPEVSLRKIYSAIYNYYFRSGKGKRIFSATEFIDANSFRLDKPALFFISEDTLVSDVFDKLMELMESGLNNINNIDENIDLPSNFFSVFMDWHTNDKPELDKTRLEYYISSPKIKFDTANERIVLHLPVQKSRIVSDKDVGWHIEVDSTETVIDGRMIRQSSGSYLILEEVIEIDCFENVDVKYIFNGKEHGQWHFENTKDYILFDHEGTLLNKDIVKRQGCIIGLKQDELTGELNVIEKYRLRNWSDFMFYNIALINYADKCIQINSEINVEIDERPIVERSNAKLLFEELSVRSLNEGISIYERYGSIHLKAPFIDEKRCQVSLVNIDKSETLNLYISKSSENLLIINLLSLPQGTYSFSIRYKNKSLYRESFIIHKRINLENDYDLSYDSIEKEHRSIKVQKSNDYELIPSDFETKIIDDGACFSLEPRNTAVAKFIFKSFGREAQVKKIVEPIYVDILGLDNVVDSKHNKKEIEITKKAFDSEDIRIKISNYDSQYDWLSYSLSIIDHVASRRIVETKKVKFSESTTWSLQSFRDRTIDFDRMTIVLAVRTDDDQCLLKKNIMHVTHIIEMLDFKKTSNEDYLDLNWEERQENKNRILRLYNLTSPISTPIEYDLLDGSYNYSLNVKELDFGIYIPVVDYKKEESLFDNVDAKSKFFKHNEIKNYLVNSEGIRKSTQSVYLGVGILDLMHKKPSRIFKLINAVDFSESNIKELLYILIQIKYIVDIKDQDNMNLLIKMNRIIISRVLEHFSKDYIVDEIYDLKDEISIEDLKYLLTIVMSLRNNRNISDQSIDKMIEIDQVAALCAVENGSGRLTNNLIASCKKNFDHELLGLVRNYDSIFEIIRNEATIISHFWPWIVEQKNAYLLKHNFSKDRAFRIYEQENDINTFKLFGYTVDDIVESIVNERYQITTKLPKRWSQKLNVDQEILREFNRLLRIQMYDSYCEIVTRAFVSVSELNTITDDEYFEIMMRSFFSKRRNLFNRYRGYFKLLFI